ncbi:MAG: ThiF family adenylyltransferase [Clostridiales bacterium]|nr:ThiF family adenylyltransferase [Clostridiales bacterium]
MKKRYERNMNALTAEENARLSGFRVCVVGCGGLGGYVIEFLGRLGVGHITAVDGDAFEESNLNRQLLSDEGSLGENKAEAAAKRMKDVNSNVTVSAVKKYVTDENCESILRGHHIAIDALDNVKTRRLLENTAQKLEIPLVHGAIAGWFGQVCVIMPGFPVFDKLYLGSTEPGMENELGNLPFTAAATASVQAAEATKVLLGKGSALSGKLLALDLMSQDYEVFELATQSV